MDDQERPKRRKCGPRVKTGCITCRIRRVKCDEGKPNCQRCVSTGRKCDGYVTQQKQTNHRSQLRPNDGAVEVARRPPITISAPFNHTDDPRSRQLFHFYCVQSAFDLSVYLNNNFWHEMILQYSHYHPVIRQAVVAFGSSHMYALSINQKRDASNANTNALEQVQQYDRAIRSLREYMETESRPDPHVILICCALFFSCENARGNREAAWQHLENGLHIVKSVGGQRSRKLIKNESDVTGELELVASKNGSKLKAKTDKMDIDEELVYVFSRLDVQATLCKKTRKPILDLTELSKPAMTETLTHTTTFANITDAQRCLDYIHNRLARFLNAAQASEPEEQSPSTPEPDWVEEERLELNKLCETWKSCMLTFINEQSPAVRQNLQTKHAPNLSLLSGSPEWQLALQIQLLTLHHRCWWMLFRSYHNPSIFTISPNPRAEEILDICDFLAYSLPVRYSAIFSSSETDIAWKMISEIGVTAPLFVLATKCSDKIIKSRAFAQLKALRDYGNGMYHETFLDQILNVISMTAEPDDIGSVGSGYAADGTLNRLQQSMTTPTSEHDPITDTPMHGSVVAYNEASTIHNEDPGGLLDWSKPSSGI